MGSYENDQTYDDESRGLLGTANISSPASNNQHSTQSSPIGRISQPTIRNRQYRGKHRDNGRLICLIFGGILMAISFLLITIYVLKIMGSDQPIPVYQHYSAYGPQYRAGETQDERHDNFVPSIWLPAVTRGTILETLLSTAKHDMWVDTNTLSSHLDTGTAFSRENIDGLASPYPSKTPFASLQVHPKAFPVTYPSANGPVTAYIHEEYVPVKTYYLIEFYASWCGHCQRFSGHAERLAYTFNSDTNSPVRMLKVHCAGDGKDLCDAFNIRGYPTLLLADTHTWIYVLSHLMPEYFDRVSLFYLRSRGSAPPPGQGFIDTTQSLNRLTQYTSLLERVPNQGTAESVLEWMDTYLKTQRQEQHRLADNHSVFNGAFAYFEQLKRANKDDQAAPSSTDPLVKRYGFPLDDMTSFTVMPQTILSSNLLRDYKLTIEYDPRINKGVQPSIVMLTVAGISHTIPYQFDLPSQDELQQLVLERVASLASGSHDEPGFDLHLKPARGRNAQVMTNPEDDKNRRPTDDEATTTDQNKDTPTRVDNRHHMDVPTESPRIPAIPIEAIGGPETLMRKFKHGYPKHANESDQLLYWSIALREIIPMCAQSMVQFNNDRQRTRSKADDTVSVNELVSTMKTQIVNHMAAKGKPKSAVDADTANPDDIPPELLYFSLDEVDRLAKKSSAISKDSYNAYLKQESCYESITDMLSLLCEYSTFISYPNEACQTSFCLLRNTLSDFIPPPSPEDLYHLNSLADRLTLVPPSNVASAKQLKDIHSDWQMCGEPWSHFDSQDWVQCKGSQPDTRGYTCGLWSNIHSLSTALHTKASKYQEHNRRAKDYNIARSLDVPPASKFVLTLRSYIYQFFLCEECQAHFLRYSNHLAWDITVPITTTRDAIPANTVDDDHAFDPTTVSPTPPVDGSVVSIQAMKQPSTHTLLLRLMQPRTATTLNTVNPTTIQKLKPSSTDEDDAVAVMYSSEEYLILWLWDTHNKVNKRLAGLEEEYDVVDPIFPKVYFPLYGMCPHCRLLDETLCVEENRPDKAAATESHQQHRRSLLSDPECLWDDAWDYKQTLQFLLQFYSAKPSA